MPANDRQVGGNHYRLTEGEQHWDRATRLHYDPFQYIITKWVERWKDKGGVQDLEKAAHAIQKYIEVHEAFLPQSPSLDVLMKSYDRVKRIQDMFVWEGSKEGEVMFTCKACRGKAYGVNVIEAYVEHTCLEPTRGYVNQDPDVVAPPT